MRLELLCEVVLFCRLIPAAPRGFRAASRMEAALPEWGCGIGIGAEDEPWVAAWLTLRVLAVELVRWCRRLVGTGKPGPDSMWVSVKEDGCSWSMAEVEALVDDVLDTTEEFWAILSMVRSRDKRLTSNSCSCSNCE